MSALRLTASDDADDPTLALISHLAAGAPISSLLTAWAKRAGITDGTPGEVTLEIIFDTSNGSVRRAIVHRKMGADQLDHMGESPA